MKSWLKTAKILLQLFIQNLKNKDNSPDKKRETNVIDLSPIISAKNLALIKDVEIVEFSEDQLTIRLQAKAPLVDNWLWLLKVKVTRGLVFNSTFCNVSEIKENNKDKEPFTCLLFLKPEKKEKLPFGPNYKHWYKKRGNLDELKKIKITLIAPEFNVKSRNFLLLFNK